MGVVAVAGLVVWLGASIGRGAEPPQPEVPAVEIPSPLRLDEDVSIFRARGLDLLLADATTEGARADLLAAQAFPNPALTANGGRAFTYRPELCDHPGCSATSVSAGLSDQGLFVDLLIGKRR